MKRAIVITGLSGVGKTTYAESLGCPVVSYDSIHNYGTNETDYFTLSEQLHECRESETVAIDAWEFFRDPQLETLSQFTDGRKIEVQCLYMSPLQVRLSQLRKEREGLIHLQSHQRGMRKHGALIAHEMVEFNDSILESLPSGITVRRLWRNGDQLALYPDGRHLKELAARAPEDELLEWIDRTSGDPKYQTIEVEGDVLSQGYMRSEVLWRQIEALSITWPGASVADLGCFNGYFSFKAERMGASNVTGYDKDSRAVTIANTLGLLNSSSCRFVEADLSSGGIPDAEIVLALNDLHHIWPNVGDFFGVLPDSCRDVVVTANHDQVEDVRSLCNGFRLVDEVDAAHFEGRKLMRLRSDRE